MSAARVVLGTAALNQTPLDFVGNRTRILAAIAAAREQRVAILNLPELCITGYGCEDMFLSLWTLEQAEQSLSIILPHTNAMLVTLGLPVYFEGAVYNAVAVCWDGKLVGVSGKKMLPREGLHYEQRWFRAWPKFAQDHLQLCGSTVPFGDQIYAFENLKLALEICEEAWGSEPGASAHAAQGCDIILNPSASHFALGKQVTRTHLVANNSRAMATYYLYANLVGNEAGRVIYDGAIFIAECGNIVAAEQSFSFKDFSLITYPADLSRPRHYKVKNRSVSAASAANRDIDVPIVSIAAPIPEATQHKAPQVVASKSPLAEPEEFMRAVVLGLADYMRKSHAKGFVVSLSGGCDSGVVATLCAQTFTMLLETFGPEEMGKRYGLALPPEPKNPKSWIKQYLTLVYQSTAQSGQVTRHAAQSLAEELGATFSIVDIEPAVQIYTHLGSEILGTPMSWEKHDLALQNIQARTRAPLAWLLANVKQALLLTTSNRSEAAVGYATMDGDTAGGLAPIAGVSKHFLRGWLLWAETSCELGLGSVTSLALISKQEPTAELRPGGKQTDEADLMPYALLDRIEELFMNERLGPNEVWQRLTETMPEADPDQLQRHVTKFFSLWCANQWKRERFAPSFHLDDISFDAKTWCRFPILNGGIKS